MPGAAAVWAQRHELRQAAARFGFGGTVSVTAVAGECASRRDGPSAVSTISGFGLVSQNETQIAAALVKHGPLSIGIDAAWMQTYAGRAWRAPGSATSARSTTAF